MTHEELTAGFYQVVRRLEREETFSQEISEAVSHYAQLMDHIAS